MFEKLSFLIPKKTLSEDTPLSGTDLRILENKLNVCSGNISRAMFEMIGLKVSVLPSIITVASLKNIPNYADSDNNIVILYNGIIGTSNGSVMLSAPINSILKMAEIFLHKQHGYFEELNAENLSVIKEFSIILAGYYITALNELTNLSYAVHKPSLSVGSHGLMAKMMDNLNMALESAEVEVLLFGNDFYIESEDVKLRMLLLLKKEDALKIIKLIDEKK